MKASKVVRQIFVSGIAALLVFALSNCTKKAGEGGKQDAAAAGTISGKVTEEAGRPLAGVWVTARNDTIASAPRKTVVTDANGAYTIPDLGWPGTYQVRARVYGYADKWTGDVMPGSAVDFAYAAADKLAPAAAAAQYPAQHWFSLIDLPPLEKLQAAGFQDQRHWIGQLKLVCVLCHQLGNATTRRPKTREEWDRVLHLAGNMNAFAGLLNRDLLLDTMAAWSAKIEAGALPAQAAPRPAGEAARYQLTEWNVGTQYSYQHDFAAAYVWDPSIGPAPPKGADGKWVYTGDIGWGTIYGVSLETGEVKVWDIPFKPAETWAFQSWGVYPWKSNPHTIEVDRDGRLVILADISDEDPATVFPVGNRDIILFDPRTEAWTPIVTACDTHTLRLDRQGRYWLSGNFNLLCMYDPATGEEQAWEFPVKLEGFGGFVYGIDVAPDGTVWFSQPFGNYIGRYDPGTDSIKQWEVPAPGYGPRRFRTDSKGNVWLPLVSGHLGKFDPATEQFRFWASPGPKRQSPPGAEDYHYNLFVDRTGEAGKPDTVYLAGTNSDSIIAFDPETEAFVTYRLPRNGFYMRELEAYDGAIWTIYSSDPAKHVEKDPDREVPIPKLVRLDIPRD